MSLFHGPPRQCVGVLEGEITVYSAIKHGYDCIVMATVLEKRTWRLVVEVAGGSLSTSHARQIY